MWLDQISSTTNLKFAGGTLHVDTAVLSWYQVYYLSWLSVRYQYELGVGLEKEVLVGSSGGVVSRNLGDFRG